MIGHFRVRVSKAAFFGLILCSFAAFVAPRAAVAQLNAYWFAGSNLIFSKAESRKGETAVALDDPGLVKFLARLGASVDYVPGQSYVVVASGDRRAITFTLGERDFTAGDIRQGAAFAPYARGGSIYVPLFALAQALYVVPVSDGNTTILQPQIGGLDVRTKDRVTTVTLRAALPLKFRRASLPRAERLVLTFSGVGSTLDSERRIHGSAELRGVDIAVNGNARNPTTTITFDATRGTAHALVSSDVANAIAVAFGKSGVALRGSPVPESGGMATVATSPARTQPSPPPAGTQAGKSPVLIDPNAISNDQYAPAGQPIPIDDAVPPPPLAPAATVTSIDLSPSEQGLDVRIGVNGALRYEWHRLTDNRWYIDLKDATLGVPGRDEQPATNAVSGVRIRQLNAEPNPAVRIAFSLTSPRHVDVNPASGGFIISIATYDELEPARVGAGRISGGSIVATAPLAGYAGDLWAPAVQPTAHPYIPTNPKLIVIDAGHGGSDLGAVHNGLIEKNVALDVARRLRTILLARGWQVRMTRDADIDVAKPNASAHDELQARCDVANDAGARMFLSVHVNSFPTSGLNGTLTYFYKESDWALASAVHKRLQTIGTVDKGLRKEEFYVIHHTTMPATLIETAFLSNPGDAALLKSPEFLHRVALAIADGIGDYAAANPLTTSSAQ